MGPGKISGQDLVGGRKAALLFLCHLTACPSCFSLAVGLQPGSRASAWKPSCASLKKVTSA